MLIGSLRIVSTYHVFSYTMDEPTHLGAGLQYLSTGAYTYEQAHTPLARVFAAIGPYLAGERFHNGPIPYYESFRILGKGEHQERILTLGRLGILPFFWIASIVVFAWTNRAAGPQAALLATLLFTTLPPVLAHSGLITTDMALTAMVSAAAYVSLLWAECPSLARSLALGIAMALALCAKLSAVPYLGAAWILMLLWYRPRFAIRPRVIPAIVAGATACVTIWAIYGFHFDRVPAPEFLAAFAEVWKHNQDGHASFILGQRHHFGVWYFFPVTLAVKTPLGLLLLLFLSPWLIRRSAVATAAAFSLAVLLFAMTARINIGVRHVLPVYVGWCIVCGAAAAETFAARRRAAGALVAALIVWHVASGAFQHPDYIAYTNEIAGSHPENFVADSDLDWGQDMKRFGEYCRRHGITEIAFRPYNITYVEMGGPPLPRLLPSEWDRPSPGWNAVSMSGWKVFNHPGWVDRRPPEAKIGRTTWLWFFP